MRHNNSARTLGCTPAHFHDEGERAEISSTTILTTLVDSTVICAITSVAPQASRRGERRTHFYLSSERKVRDRIRRDLGKDLRFVVILRDPVKRAWSHYLHQRRRGAETESFERALELEPTRLSADGPTWTTTAYFGDGLYAHDSRLVGGFSTRALSGAADGGSRGASRRGRAPGVRVP